VSQVAEGAIAEWMQLRGMADAPHPLTALWDRLHLWRCLSLSDFHLVRPEFKDMPPDPVTVNFRVTDEMWDELPTEISGVLDAQAYMMQVLGMWQPSQPWPHLEGISGAPVGAQNRCLAAFDSSGFAQQSGGLPPYMPGVLHDGNSLDEAQEDSAQAALNGFQRKCFLRDGIYFGFSPGLAEAAKLPKFEKLAILLDALPQQDKEERKRFGVCAPPPPRCKQDDGTALGWHYILRHVLGAYQIFQDLATPPTAEAFAWLPPSSGARSAAILKVSSHEWGPTCFDWQHTYEKCCAEVQVAVTCRKRLPVKSPAGGFSGS